MSLAKISRRSRQAELSPEASQAESTSPESIHELSPSQAPRWAEPSSELSRAKPSRGDFIPEPQ